MSRYNLFQVTSLSPERTWADTWHLWTVMMPRRSITGRLLWGKVWRRHDGRRWIYKKFVEYEPTTSFDGSTASLRPWRTRRCRARSEMPMQHRGDDGHRCQQTGRGASGTYRDYGGHRWSCPEGRPPW